MRRSILSSTPIPWTKKSWRALWYVNPDVLTKITGPADQWKVEFLWSTGSYGSHGPSDQWEFWPSCVLVCVLWLDWWRNVMCWQARFTLVSLDLKRCVEIRFLLLDLEVCCIDRGREGGAKAVIRCIICFACTCVVLTGGETSGQIKRLFYLTKNYDALTGGETSGQIQHLFCLM